MLWNRTDRGYEFDWPPYVAVVEHVDGYDMDFTVEGPDGEIEVDPDMREIFLQRTEMRWAALLVLEHLHIQDGDVPKAHRSKKIVKKYEALEKRLNKKTKKEQREEAREWRYRD